MSSPIVVISALCLVATLLCVSGATPPACNISIDSSHDLQTFVNQKLPQIMSTLSSDFVVCLDGSYDVSDNSLSFNATHSGKFSVIFLGSSISNSTVINGGKHLVNWEKTVSPNTYRAVVATSTVIRNIWINGVRASRSSSQSVPVMTPWISDDKLTAGYTIDKSKILQFACNDSVNIQALEFVYPIVVANWIEPRCTIASFNETSISIGTCGGILNSRNVYSKVFPSVKTIENVCAGYAPIAGTFFHDVSQGYLYYTLTESQSLNDLQSNAWYASQQILLQYTNVSNHIWQNVKFQYGAWHQVNSDNGYVEIQSAVYKCDKSNPECSAGSPYGFAEPRGNVRLSHSSSITFDNCEFINMGGVYALSMMEGSQHVSVSRSRFFDVSGGFIKLGSVDRHQASSANASDWDANFVVSNNKFESGSLEYHGAACIFGGFLWSLELFHNTLIGCGYSGVSVGWGWTWDKPPPGYGNNTISYNYISNVMTELKDGGCIYVNGGTSADYKSTISNNYCKQVMAVYAVYYLDNGSSNWIVSNNVASHSPLAWSFFMTGGTAPSNSAVQNHIQDFWYDSYTAAPRNDCAKYNCTVGGSVVSVTGEWPPPALVIIANAGTKTK